MQELIGAALAAFSVSLVLGAVLTHLNDWGWRWLGDPKIVATAVTWAVYAVLFHLRTAGGRRGRGMALVALVGLACVLFSLLGVHWVSESIHGFVTSSVGAG